MKLIVSIMLEVADRLEAIEKLQQLQNKIGEVEGLELTAYTNDQLEPIPNT